MKSVLIIGMGRFGRHVAMQLTDLGHEVMAVDKEERRINACLDYVTNAQIGNSTNAEFLKSLGPDNFDLCIVSISSNFQSSLETTSLLKELGAPLVVSRAERDVQAKFLLRNGADHVVYPEKQMAKWTAIRYSADHILDFIDLDDSNGIFEVTVPEPWIGKSIGQLDIRKKYQINIIAFKKNGKMDPAVKPDIILTPDLTLLVLGSYKNLQRCFRIGR
jgi:trk system potassium uptake protein TrkA